MKLSSLRRLPPIEAFDWPIRHPLAALASLSATAKTYLVAYRQAKAAEALHDRLSHMSDCDLARQGLARADLTRHVRERLDQGA